MNRSCRSSWALAPNAIRQGSVLSHLLFIFFASYLASLLASQMHADDFQAYQHCLPSGASANGRAMTMSIAMEALINWMSSNLIRFNSPNTQFIGLAISIAPLQVHY